MTTEKKMFRLTSSDGVIFELDETAALFSGVVRQMVELGCADDDIPASNVSSEILSKVVGYCKAHAGFAALPAGNDREESTKKWDAKFVEVDLITLFQLIHAANYLCIDKLLDMLCETVAAMMRKKSVQELREKFNIKNDYTREEEREIRKDMKWAFKSSGESYKKRKEREK